MVCFLGNLFLLWKKNHLVLKIKLYYEDDCEFMTYYIRSVLSIQNQMCEFYLHEFLIGDYVESFLNPYVGEIQIRAFLSFMQNQVEREKMDHYNESYKRLGLPIRDEFPNSNEQRGSYRYVARLDNVGLIYERNLNQVIRNFKNVQETLATIQGTHGYQRKL